MHTHLFPRCLLRLLLHFHPPLLISTTTPRRLHNLASPLSPSFMAPTLSPSHDQLPSPPPSSPPHPSSKLKSGKTSPPRRALQSRRALSFQLKNSASRHEAAPRSLVEDLFPAVAKRVNLGVAQRSRTSRSRNGIAPRSHEDGAWRSLGLESSELCLNLTLPTGQSFRWKQTGTSEFTGAVGTYLISLRQVEEDVQFLIHQSEDGCTDDAQAEMYLRDYLNLSMSLRDIWATFIATDARFAALAPYMAGARLLRQDPLECVFQFICSSNNHIQRISQMVDYLASLGPYLGTVKGQKFHAFPSLNQLFHVTEVQLRNAGFGYRAKYIVETVKDLTAKEGGGEKWLLSLRNKSLQDAIEALCSLSGIGPKVAACIALFSLDQHHAIPVDTHVWQIATKYITPELAGERLTMKLHNTVSEAFVKRFGRYAGWAQTVLFIAELSSHQGLLPEHLRTQKMMKVKAKRKKMAET